MQVNTKKSISALIATILLVVVAVALIAILLNWGKAFTSVNLNQATNFSHSEDLTTSLWYDDILFNNVRIKNTSNKEISIVGYKIIGDTPTESLVLNKIMYLDYPVTIAANNSGYITLPCFPNNSFYLELYTSDNVFATFKISKISIQRDGCLMYDKNYVLGWWDFKDINSTTIYDKSDRNNNGTINLGTKGNTSLATFINQGNYIVNLDGNDDYILFLKNADFNMGYGVRTVTMFFNPPTSLTSDGTLFSIGAGGGAKGHDLEVRPSLAIYAELYGDVGGRQSTSVYNSVIKLGSWNFVCVQYLRDRIIMFLKNEDGDEYSSVRLITDPDFVTSTYNPKIGSYVGSSLWLFKGYVSETMYFNRALSENEINSLYYYGLSKLRNNS